MLLCGVSGVHHNLVEFVHHVFHNVRALLSPALISLISDKCVFVPDPIIHFPRLLVSCANNLRRSFDCRMGGFDLALYTGSHNPVVATMLLLVFLFTMSMVRGCKPQLCPKYSL